MAPMPVLVPTAAAVLVSLSLVSPCGCFTVQSFVREAGSSGFSPSGLDQAMGRMKASVTKLIEMTHDARAALDAGMDHASLLEIDGHLEAPRPSLLKGVLETAETAALKNVNFMTSILNRNLARANERLGLRLRGIMTNASDTVDDMKTNARDALANMEVMNEHGHHMNRSKLLSATVVSLAKTDKALDEMKGNFQAIARTFTNTMKNASAQVAQQISRSVQENVRHELDLARTAEPASLLEISAAHQSVAKIRSSADEAMDNLKDLLDSRGREMVSRVPIDVGVQMGEALFRSHQAIDEMKAGIAGLSDTLAGSLQALGGEAAPRTS